MPVLWIFSLCALTSALANRSMDPLVTAVARDFNSTVAAAAVVVSMYAFPYAFAQPILGPIGDYYGKGRVLKFCMWLQIASMALVVFSPTLGVLMVARFVGGFAGGGIMPIGMALVGDHAAPAERQAAIARYVSVALIGMMMSSALAGMLAVYVSWRGIFVIALVFSIACAVLMTIYIKDAPVPARRMRIADATGGYRVLFSNPRAFVCFAAVLLEGTALYGVMPFIGPLLEERGRGGPFEAGLIITGLAFGAFAFTSTVKYTLRIFTRFQLIFLGGAITAMGPLSLAFDLSWTGHLAAFTLAGVGYMMFHNSMQAEVAELAPNLRASAFAMHSCSFFTGQSLGPILFALMSAGIGSSGSSVVFASGLILLGPAIALLLRRLPQSQTRDRG